MGKSTRTPIMAAGGIVIRNGTKPLISVVQRRRDNAWVLPKGKLKPNEKPLAAARREAKEETGCAVRVHEYLGVISYIGGSGPKVAHFWRMQAIGSSNGKPTDDIKAVEWLPLPSAIERLSLPHEQTFLRNIGRKALRRTVKKARRKPPVEEAATTHVSGATPPVVEHPPAQVPELAAAVKPLAAPEPALAPRTKLAKPQPRWEVLARLSQGWQSAVRRTRRTG